MFRCKNSLVMAVGLSLTYLCGLGCVSIVQRPSLVVGNATEHAVKDAVLTSGDESYSFGTIPEFEVSQRRNRYVALEKNVLVRWVDSDGQKKSGTVTLGEALRDYGGHMQFEINENDRVKVFTAPSEASGDSELPWSMPANWEGSPTLPGMN